MRCFGKLVGNPRINNQLTINPFKKNIKRINMHKYILFFFVFFISFQTNYAQNVAGYQGKRFLAEYNFQPALASIFQSGSFSSVHNFHFAFIASRRIQVGAAFDLFSPPVKDSELVTIKGNALGVNVDYYIKNNRAPVGPFVRAELRFLNAENSVSQTVSRAVIGGGFGIRRIIQDRFTINFGAMLGWVMRESTKGGFVQVQEVIGESDLQRLYVYRFHFGVGALLF